MRISPRRQGDIGELSAMEWLAGQGYSIYVPVGHSRDVDLIAVSDTETLRVQVKTTTQHIRNGRYQVMLCTRGGNQSWNGVTKYFSSDRCDYLFVHAGDGRRFFIPSGEVEGRSSIMIGGPKYAAYEVERGRPILTVAEP